MDNEYYQVKLTSWGGLFDYDFALAIPKSANKLDVLARFENLVKDEFYFCDVTYVSLCASVSRDKDGYYMYAVENKDFLQLDPDVYVGVLEADMEIDNYKEVTYKAYICH